MGRGRSFGWIAGLALVFAGAGCATESRLESPSPALRAQPSGLSASPERAEERVWRRLPVLSAELRPSGDSWQLVLTVRVPQDAAVRLKAVPTTENESLRFEVVGLARYHASETWPAGSLIENVDLSASAFVVIVGAQRERRLEVPAAARIPR